VSFEKLPASWRAKIEAQDSADGQPSKDAEPSRDAETERTGKRIDTRREKSLLRVIRALLVEAKLPDRGAAPSVVKQLEVLGFNSPKDDVVAGIIVAARALESD
jgi:hypothetical protein